MESSEVGPPKEVIVGIHSIEWALKNPQRKGLLVYGTEDSLKALRKRAPSFPSQTLKTHELQELARKLLGKLHHERIAQNLLLVAERRPPLGLEGLYEKIQRHESFTLVALNQVTDVHNIGAVLRTCSFFHVKALLISVKGPFHPPSAMIRIASGGYEHVPIVNVPSFPRVMPQLKKRGLFLLGFSEHAPARPPPQRPSKVGLFFGSEEKGLSHAVGRNLHHCTSLAPAGPLASLNVSVAVALGLERFGTR